MPILYTAVGYASSDINRSVISFVYTCTGYTKIIINDINLGWSGIGLVYTAAGYARLNYHC